MRKIYFYLLIVLLFFFFTKAESILLTKNNPEFTYNWGFLLKKTGKLTASITGVLYSQPVVGEESRILVTSEILKDDNYQQYQTNMGWINQAEPYFMEQVIYLLIPSGTGNILKGQIEYWENGQWHLVDQKNILDAYKSRDSKAAQIIQTLIKKAAVYAFGFSDFIHIYRKPEIAIPDDISFFAVPFIEHRKGKFGS